MAGANWEQYQVNKVVGNFAYAHNQYLVALATRGLPGLTLFLLFMTLPIYIAMKHKSADAEDEVARLSLISICLAYLVGCLGEDHFETQPAIMFVSLFLALLLARISNSNRGVETRIDKHATDRC